MADKIRLHSFGNENREVLGEPMFDGGFLGNGGVPMPPYCAGVLTVFHHQIVIQIEHLDESGLFRSFAVEVGVDVLTAYQSHVLLG